MWEPIWASRFRYWLLTGDVSRSCLHSSRTRRVRTLKVSMIVLLWVYEFWCTEGSSESRMRSQTWRGVLECPRHKDWYIGRLYSDTGSVPEKFVVEATMPRRSPHSYQMRRQTQPRDRGGPEGKKARVGWLPSRRLTPPLSRSHGTNMTQIRPQLHSLSHHYGDYFWWTHQLSLHCFSKETSLPLQRTSICASYV